MRADTVSSLARFQDAFARALAVGSGEADAIVASLVAQPAFAVYRNTVAKGCIDALQANYPSVNRLVGDEWFRAAAAIYARGELPTEPSLLAYGASFPEFIAGFPPAAELAYLPDVARLDWQWTLAHVAADKPALEPAALTNLDPEALSHSVLHPHPAARWAWFPDAPIYTIWRRNREESRDESEIDWRGEGALLTRPVDAVRWTALDEAGCHFLDACAQGQPVIRALDAALAVDSNADLLPLISTLFSAGAFGRLSPGPIDTFSRNTP